MDEKARWVLRALDVTIPGSQELGAQQAPGSGPPTTATMPAPEPEPTGMAAWTAARGKALSALEKLESAFRSSGDSDADAAVMLLRAIHANLTELPETPQQIDELESYIGTDDIFTDAEEPNGFGVTVELRKPLLAALAGLRHDQDGKGTPS